MKLRCLLAVVNSEALKEERVKGGTDSGKACQWRPVQLRASLRMWSITRQSSAVAAAGVVDVVVGGVLVVEMHC